MYCPKGEQDYRQRLKGDVDRREEARTPQHSGQEVGDKENSVKGGERRDVKVRGVRLDERRKYREEREEVYGDKKNE